MIIEQFLDTGRFTPAEQQIIDFINNHPRVVVNLSLQDLSQECYVSQASIIRFVKKLGLKGFADFKVHLAQELNAFAVNDQCISVDIPIPPESTCQEIAQIFYNLSLQTLESTFNSLDFNAIKRAANMLAAANTIHLFGRGESLVIAEDFHYKLLRLGYNSVLETLNGFQDVYSLQPKSRRSDVAIVISQYCNSRHTNFVIDELMNSHTPMILVTAAQNAWPYDRYAEVTLRITNTESRYKMGSFASRTAFQYLLDCVYGQLFSLQYQKNSDNLRLYSERRAARDYYYKVLSDNSKEL